LSLPKYRIHGIAVIDLSRFGPGFAEWLGKPGVEKTGFDALQHFAFYLSHRASKGAFDQRERQRLLIQDKRKVHQAPGSIIRNFEERDPAPKGGREVFRR